MSQLVSDRYELEHPSTQGSMGEISTAYDPRLERRVVVKRMRQDLTGDPEMVKRFEREAQFTARVSHPGIPMVLDYGTDDRGPYLILEHVEGRNLGDVNDAFGPLPAGWIAAIGAQVCAVLDHAYAASLIHRDLTPANILPRPDGTVTLIDFGVAVVIGASRLSTDHARSGGGDRFLPGAGAAAGRGESVDRPLLGGLRAASVGCD